MGRSVAGFALAASLAGIVRADVHWQSGAVSRPVPMPRAELAQELKLHAASGARHVVVHWAGPVDAQRRAGLEAGGLRLLSYLGGHAWFGVLSADANLEAAAEFAGLAAIEAIDPRNKLHPDLAAGIVHPWSVVPPTSTAGGVSVAVYLLFHPDVAAAGAAAPLVARHGGEVRSYLRAVNGVVAHVPMSQVPALAAEDAVMWIEPPLPRLEEINSENRARVGADVLQEIPWDLDGSGVNVLVYDGGRVAPHGDLAGRLTIGVGDTSTLSDHATHVACTVAGDGAGSGGSLRGMAPAATVTSYGFEQEGGLQPGFLYTDPGDLEADYTSAIALHGADLSNNSIGSNVASNGFPCEWEGNYGVTGALIDEIARGATGAPFRIVWANGNERSTGICGGGYHTTAPPACAKNHITVGALYSDLDEVTSFSSWGPCDDGRLKPDVSAPGCQASGDFGVTSCSSGGAYNVKCGTSMSSPTVAGLSALLLQQFRASYPGRGDFRGSTLKAVLAQTAADLGNAGPDYQTGYGSVRAVPAAETIALGKFDESEVAQDGVALYGIAVDPGTAQLKVTLAWDDPAGAPDVDPVLVNDLDLRVVDPGGGVHHPWTLDPANPFLPAVGEHKDAINNIEQVVIDAPSPGFYRVEVVGFDLGAGDAQAFSLAADPNLNSCSSAGTLSIDAAHVQCQAEVGIEVIDCDPNLDDGQSETVTVGVASASEPSGESVVLTEVAPFLSRFAGVLTLAPDDAPGVLHVADGETVTVTYVDADDGAGGTDVEITRQLSVDCVVPVITAVATHDVTRHEATVDVTVSEDAFVEISYGTSCSDRPLSFTSAEFTAGHQIDLTGLAGGSTYFYTVEARDLAGNAAVDDASGACYAFATQVIPDFLTQQFPNTFDLEGTMLTFTPTGPPDGYAACAEPLPAGLPTDPEGGTDLNLGDDVPQSFALAGGERVRLYGVEYATVWVGPNGFLTFGQGDNVFEETLEAHFSLPRVAALFDDLHPGAAGSGGVSWKQLADRVAVSWIEVPQLQQGDRNTFQIEMFFDGRIRLSWLEVDATDAIVGLSAGAGLDPDFATTDLSAAAGCGPFPPLVQDVQAATGIAQPVDVRLLAVDDGLPEPSGLTYRIAALPAFGTLSDPADGASVVSAPHDLAGEWVTYRPYPGFGGQDQFAFTADDSGTAPAGGESPAGTVSVGVAIGAPSTVFEFLTDDAGASFSATGAWACGTPSGSGSHAGDPAGGATGENVCGYNLEGDYSNGMAQETLTTAALDLSHVNGTRLEFARWLGVEGSAHDHAAVQISTDGTSWANVWSHLGPAVNDSAWSTRSYDVALLADGRPAVAFRWVMGTTDVAVTYPGWNIDDVRIVGTRLPTCNRTPGEATNLLFAADGRTLVWEYSKLFGEAQPVYDTLRSDSTADFTAAVCIEADSLDRSAEDAELPPPGHLYAYLVRVDGDCGPGPLGGALAAPPCAP